MTSLELLQEIDAWLSFNNSPSKKQISELRNDIKKHISEQLNAPFVINNEAEASSEGVAVCCDTCKYVNGFRCKHPQGCETDGGYDFWEQRTDL